MIVALIDNGSLEPAAHRNLRAVAAALSARTGANVRAVSWKHSDRISVAQLDGTPAWTLAPFLRSMCSLGQREFVFVPFFVSAQGAIGSALRADIEKLQHALGGFDFTFTDGLAARGAIPQIVAGRIRETLTSRQLHHPHAPTPVVIVDHGGPSPASAQLRNELTAQIAALFDAEADADAAANNTSLPAGASASAPIGPFLAASMEGEAHPHNHPLLRDVFSRPGFDHGPIVIAPLFLSPGRHAGPDADLVRIARAAETRLVSAALRCHFTGLVGTHPLAIDALSDALRHTLSTFQAPILA